MSFEFIRRLMRYMVAAVALVGAVFFVKVADLAVDKDTWMQAVTIMALWSIAAAVALGP